VTTETGDGTNAAGSGPFLAGLDLAGLDLAGPAPAGPVPGSPAPGGPGLAVPTAPPGVAAAFAARRRADPAGPLLTFYDDATGERTELSATSLDNWVAKTANLIVDTVGGLAADEPVGVDLPTHWQSAVILLAVWTVGGDPRVAAGAGRAASPGPAAPPRLAFVDERRLTADGAADRLRGVGDVVALSLRPFGQPLSTPAGVLARSVRADVLDYAAEVPAHGDAFAAPAPPPGQATVTRLATRAAARWELTTTDRVLTTAGYESAAGLLAGLLAPLVAGASVVVCAGADPARLPRRIEVEKVSAVYGPDFAAGGPAPAGARVLAGPR
jgi:uncharacterized protein (TIGR03089 family)